MKRKIYIILLSLSILTPTIIFANEETSEKLQNNQVSEKIVGNEYWTSWKITSKLFNKYVYGSWFRIVSGQGGPGVTLSSQTERTVSNSYTGSLKVSKKILNTSIGFDVTKSDKRTATYSMKCPDPKKRYILRGRDTKAEYKVIQKRTYMVGSIASHSESAIVYPQKWNSFDYGYYTEGL